MIQLELNKTISLDLIMSMTDDFNIFKFYIERTGTELKVGKSILSPLRDESNPSFIVYVNENGKLMFKDFASGDSGSAIDMVMKIYDLSFGNSVIKIYNDMFVDNDYSHIDKKPFTKEVYRTEKSNINIEKQKYTLSDYRFWNQFGISIATLLKYNVISAKYIWVNGFLGFTYLNSNPIYVYNFNNNYKIYRPFSVKRYKWRVYGQAENTIEGIEQLNYDNDLLIITKSLKDVMLLDELGYSAVAMSGESVIPKQEFIDEMRAKFKDIVIFLDNDETGLKMSKIISEEYSLPSITLPKDCKRKDLSDYYKKYGKESAVEILKLLLDGYNLPNTDSSVYKKDRVIEKETSKV